MSQYITSADILSTIWQDFDLNEYINKTNDHVEYIAQSMGLTSADISSPINSVLKEYAVAFCERSLAKDKMGTNNLDIQTNDKYFILFNIQNDEVERLRKYITPELIKQTATDPSEYSPSVTIYRG